MKRVTLVLHRSVATTCGVGGPSYFVAAYPMTGCVVAMGYPADRTMGLKRRVLLHRSGEGVFEDVVRLRKALFHIALAELEMVADIAALDRSHARCAAVGTYIFVDEGRLRSGCLDGVEHGGQLFVLDLDELHRTACGLLVDRRDRCHPLTSVAHLVSGQKRLVTKTLAMEKRQVRASDDPLDAGQVLGPGGIDTQNPSVKQPATENGGS